MTIPADILFFTLGVLLVVGFRRNGERLLLAGAVASAGALLLDILKLPRIQVRVGILDLALLLVLAVLAAHVQGLPPAIARRIGMGFRSREWEFDRRFHMYREQFDELLSAYRPSTEWADYQRWQARALRTGRRLLAKMQGLQPPDDAWAHVRDDYVDLYAQIMTLIAHNEQPDDAYTLSRGTELKRRADALRLKYRESARAVRMKQ